MRQLKISQQITNRESQSLDKYLHEIGRVELITADEEVELAKRIRNGDEVALSKLVRANLRFVVSVAKQYQSNALSLGDLINEGNVGLVKAASRFDETRGFKFISYAVWWIRQSIMQALAERSGVVRLPLNRISAIRQISRKSSELEQIYEREPTSQEIAEVLDMSHEEVIRNVMASGHQVSLDAPFVEGESNSLKDLLKSDLHETPDSLLMDQSLEVEIRRALSTLTPREADIIVASFGLNGKPAQSMEEIGLSFAITRERVRQIREKAIRRLQHGSRSKILRNYLG